MTTTDNTSKDSIDGPKSATSYREGYKWTCPHCGETRLNNSKDKRGEMNAITALRAHVYTSDGSGHGSRRQYPTGYDSRTIAEHVVEVGSRD